MKRINWLSLAFLVLLFGYLANADVTNLKVNGFSSNFTMVQGDSIKWEYNLPFDGTAEGKIWVDLNGNGVLDPLADKSIMGAIQTDGQSVGVDNNPGDMDGLVNGHILTVMGNVSLPPAKYIFNFSNSGIAQSIAGTVTALPSPPYTVSGVVTVPGTSAQNIFVQAKLNKGGWGALTDASGNYTINLNAAAGGLEWGIRPEDQIPSYVRPDRIYRTLTGNLTGINFTYEPVTSVWENQSDELPRGFSLSQNYPNPFNPTTVIDYQIATKSLVSLRVYDLLGHEIAALVNEEKSPGMYKVRWDANIVSSGVYLCRLQAGNNTKTIKLLFIR